MIYKILLTDSLQSAFYLHSAFYPWFAVCCLHFTLTTLINHNSFKVLTPVLLLFLPVCDDHRFKDEMLFYRFRRDDDTVVTNPDFAIIYKGCDIYYR